MTPGLLSGNRITLLKNGMEFFPALQVAIDAARQEIHLETYIFANDVTGRTIAAALSRAALRGVIVRLVLDGFGSKALPTQLLNEMRRDGVEILIFRPEPGILHLRRNRLRRLHRKLCMVDARTAFVGGINIIDDMDTPGQIPPRYDYAVRVEGPVLAQIAPVMRRLWKLVKWTQGRRAHRLHSVVVHSAPAGEQQAALLIRDNLRHRRDIEEAYLDAINAARGEIIIANAYFLPGIRFRRALIEAAGARREGFPAVAGQGGISLAALCLARSLWPIPGGRNNYMRIPQELSARQSRGNRPALGHCRLQ